MFTKLADKVSIWAGRPATFIACVALVLLWAICGPIFGFSSIWQLVINTATTIITFLMVFLIQNTANRGDAATQLKLDAVIKALEKADNRMMGAEDETEETLAELKQEIRNDKD